MTTTLGSDPRIGGADADTWHAIPAPSNPDGKRTGGWVIVAGDYADEGEPDIYIEIQHAEHPEDVAKFIVQAVHSEWARQNQGANR